jgi:hypothetical protein
MTPCADAADAGAPSHEEGSSKGKTRRGTRGGAGRRRNSRHLTAQSEPHAELEAAALQLDQVGEDRSVTSSPAQSCFTLWARVTIGTH